LPEDVDEQLRQRIVGGDHSCRLSSGRCGRRQRWDFLAHGPEFRFDLLKVFTLFSGSTWVALAERFCFALPPRLFRLAELARQGVPWQSR
jgi:hypothetical protein